MKKSLLFLSVLAVAGTAAAFDTPVAGTADAPNYYIIKNNRGDVNYLGCGTPTGTIAHPTDLVRTADFTEANIWAVTPGTAEGTVVMKNYATDKYLMNFVSADGTTSTSAGAVAVTLETPADIYLAQLNNGAFSISLSTDPNACVFLDASNQHDGLGNWFPGVNGGSDWWFTQLDLSNGVEAALNAAKSAAMAGVIEQYVGYLNAYKESVPVVAAELQAGIDKLNAYEYSDDYATAIPAIYNEAVAAADAALATVLNEKVFAMKNLRRAVTDPTAGAYLTVAEAKDVYGPATSFASENSHFKFISAGNGGYKIYNEATQTYLYVGTNEAGATRDMPTADEAAAQIVYPRVHSSGGYSGVAFCINEDKTGNGLNWHSTDDSQITLWSYDDGGSIWALVDCDPQAAVDEVAATYAAAYEKYIANVPEVKAILDKAIADIRALEATATLGEEAAAIDAKAMADANALLATCYAGKLMAIHSLRQNDYLAFANDVYGHSTDAEASEVCFEFKAVEGGYVLRHEATGKFVAVSGELSAESIGVDMVAVETEAEAAKVAPVLYNAAGHFGVALYIGDITEADGSLSNVGLNQNTQEGLWIYYIADGGSIWSVAEFTGSGISEISASKPAMEGIYDLQGRKLAAPVKGINIINGVKVIVK